MIPANSPASCQHLLSRVADWLQWSGMAAKIPKCQCISLRSSTGKLVDPKISLNDTPITHPRPGGSRKSLTKAAKAVVMDEINTYILDSLHNLERQGQMSRCSSPECASIWSKVVQSVPEEQMKFALNAAVDVLPHNANLHLWKKRKDPLCPLCHQNQSLLHVLNNCAVARDARRYNSRHDAVLAEIATAVSSTIPITSRLTADIGDTYTFPLHIVPTDLRPDLVWWDDKHRSLTMAELTVCFETNFEEAVLRKKSKYTDLVEQATARGYKTTLITLQVGSRGAPHLPGFQFVASLLNMPSRDLSKLLEAVSRQALTGSFGVWCSRNRTP